LDPIIQQRYNSETNIDGIIVGDGYEFRLGDGVEGSKLLKNQSIDLLLTDPPYGISNPYVCETQISRRLRNDGSDFIMPKGSFGDWDNHVNPKAWTDAVLPKVGGWAVIFCAQAQIGEYCDILKQHKFVAVGPMVWQKTNPVPFNHKYKPVNAWEAIVIGKRPGTKFNGHVVHNVFTCKSPSPQERIHPTQKPLPLLKEFVELFSGQGELVLDPFAGSATTVIAALEANRLVIAYEKDGEIYQQASNRIANRVTRLRLC
jgi:site-specific DNA-methyltransferase (adenine-specific)